MKNYSDPTANAAIGSVDKEFRAKQKLAVRLKALRLDGKLSDKTLNEARKEFTGIFARLYDGIFED